MSDIEPKKLKVAELRDELKARGLESKGNKAQLVKRLEKALAKDADIGVADVSTEDSVLETTLDTSTEEHADVEPVDVAQEEPESQPESAENDVQECESETEQPATQKEPEIEAASQEPEETELEPESAKETSDLQPEAEEPQVEAQEDQTETEMCEDEVSDQQSETINSDEPNSVTDDVTDDVKPIITSESDVVHEDSVVKDDSDVQLKTSVSDAAPEIKQETPEIKQEIDEPMTEGEGGPEPEAEYQVMDAIEDSEAIESDQKSEIKEEEEEDDARHGKKRRHSRSRSRDRYRRSSRRRSRSRSPRRRSADDESPHSRHQHSRPTERKAQDVPESEDWLQATNCVMDRYNCDLNMRIDDTGYKGSPITVEGFAFMWAGVRSNYGVSKGQVCFEVNVKDNLNVDHLPDEETNRHIVRVGWSPDTANTQLGEDKLSFGYGGTGKASVDSKFKDFGSKFKNGDCITAYIDFENDGPVLLTFSKNGEDLGTCFEVDRDELGDQVLFPHVLSKNCEFFMNFGQLETPTHPIKEGFVFINDVPEADRVKGTAPPAKKEDCEITMMCGLPAAGKTVWAAKKAQELPDKRYNVLGTNNIIDKMKVMGLPRKRNYTGRWDVLIDKATKCLNRMLEIAAKKKRNYIVDQTNVYPSAQRRKMRPFEGFQRTAVVIVPTDEEYKNRREAQQKEEGKDVPDEAILEMKANFALPEEGPTFDKVEFIELEREEAQTLVESYNKDGQAAFPPDQKRWRRDDRYGGGGGGRDFQGRERYDSRERGRGGSCNSYSRDRGYYNSNDRRGSSRSGNYNDRRSGGSSGGSYMGYSSYDRQRASSYNSRDSSSSSRDRRRDDNRNSSSSSTRDSRNYGNYKSDSSTSSWSNNQGSWGNQGNSSWGNQGWGQQGWGQQGYNQGWGGQWSGYGQNQTSSSTQQGNWGQNYNQYWGQQQQQQQQPAAVASATSTTQNWSSGTPANYTQGQNWYGYNNYQK